MKTNNILNGPSFLPHKNPKKLIFMLHGYGDTAENFINISTSLDLLDLNANYLALNAPTPTPNYPMGRQWFDLNPNGVYIADAGPKEIEIIHSEILLANEMIENTINVAINKYKLTYKDCFLLGFSQGGMMAFEFGNYFTESLGGLAILSGRIITENIITNQSLIKTPIFISHGDSDDVLPIKVYDQSCNYLQTNNLIYESHKIQGDTHTISIKVINLLQKFIKKTMM